MKIDTVAKMAGVSPATVSRVLNSSAPVSEDKAERVRATIKKLRFLPNTNARALASARSGLFGLIISDITNPFFPDLVKAFEDVAIEHGREVLIADTNYDPQRMHACVTRMLQRQVDGVAILTSELDAGALETLRERGVPTVVMDSGKLQRRTNVVRVDYADGIRLAVEHLRALGHQNLGFISGPPSLISARLRVRAFREALQAHGLKVKEEWIVEGNHRVAGGREAATQLLQRRQRPTALVCSNDLTAIGALGALTDAGVRVPDEMSLTGFDDIEISSYVTPSLTTLRIPRQEIAAAAFRMLLAGMVNKDRRSIEEHSFSPTLVERGTTGPRRGSGRASAST